MYVFTFYKKIKFRILKKLKYYQKKKKKVENVKFLIFVKCF